MSMNKNAMSIFMMAGLVMSNAAVGDANDNEIFIAQTGNNV